MLQIFCLMDPFPTWVLIILLCICSTVTMLVKGPGSSLVGFPWPWVWEWDKYWKNTKWFYLIFLFFSASPGESEVAAVPLYLTFYYPHQQWEGHIGLSWDPCISDNYIGMYSLILVTFLPWTSVTAKVISSCRFWTIDRTSMKYLVRSSGHLCFLIETRHLILLIFLGLNLFSLAQIS